MKDILALIPDHEYQARLKAARARAQWELGDPSWAGLIIGAFLHPVEDSEALAAEMEEG